MHKFRVLSIDAQNGPDGWQWNQWFSAGIIEGEIPRTNRAILALMRREGYISAASAGRVAVEDDQYNIVIVDRANRRPLFAIEYGNHDDDEQGACQECLYLSNGG